LNQLLVIGCGFHRQFTGKEDNVLNSWKILLEAIAKNEGLKAPIGDTHLTHTWERLALERVQKSKFEEAASKAEERLRNAACRTILEASEKLKGEKHRDKFKELLKGFKGHILNLNFDRIADEWIGAAKRGVIQRKHFPKLSCCTKSQARNLFQRWIVCNSRESDPTAFVWHPHGMIDDEQTLRLGMRDYGLQPAAYAQAFKELKAWQSEIIRQNGGRLNENEPITEQQHQQLLHAIDKIDKLNQAKQKTLKLHDNWLTRFMLLDVSFIGVGLSDAEIGMHWLLTQRTRNFARIHSKKKPSTKYYCADPNLPIGFFEYDVSQQWDTAWRKAIG